jgi:hypothetical protein
MEEIYVSTDVETDGPMPGPHSMCSFASAAFRADKTLVDTYTANLELLPGAAPDPERMAWWADHPEAWRACRLDPRPPGEVMPEYAAWVDALPGNPIFVAYPVGFDFAFVYWYLMRFAGRSPFRHHGVDIRSYAMGMLGETYEGASWHHYPARWFDDLPHTHEALDDAIRQGTLFCNILAENAERGS